MRTYAGVCMDIMKELASKYGVPAIDVVWDEYNYFSSCDEYIAVNEEDAARFEKVFRKIVSDMDAAANEFSVYLLSFLHEVGHWMDEDELYDSFEYQLMNDIVADIEDEDEGADLYMRSPAEWVATEWAVNFVTAHKEDARKYDNWIKEVV